MALTGDVRRMATLTVACFRPGQPSWSCAEDKTTECNDLLMNLLDLVDNVDVWTPASPDRSASFLGGRPPIRGPLIIS